MFFFLLGGPSYHRRSTQSHFLKRSASGPWRSRTEESLGEGTARRRRRRRRPGRRRRRNESRPGPDDAGGGVAGGRRSVGAGGFLRTVRRPDVHGTSTTPGSDVPQVRPPRRVHAVGKLLLLSLLSLPLCLERRRSHFCFRRSSRTVSERPPWSTSTKRSSTLATCASSVAPLHRRRRRRRRRQKKKKKKKKKRRRRSQ